MSGGEYNFNPTHSHLRTVFWEQQGLQLGKHTIQISRGAAATQPAVERHFRNLIQLYGKQVAVNLLGEKEGSAELELSDAYNKHVDNLDPEMRALVRIVNFDFHAAVKGNQFENLDTLVRQLLESIKEFGYFLINLSNRQVISTQQGAFRVNCLDCLDRYRRDITTCSALRSPFACPYIPVELMLSRDLSARPVFRLLRQPYSK